MDQKAEELEREAESLDREGFAPPITPEGEENVILTEVRRIVKTSDANPDQLKAVFSDGCLALIYDGHEFARCSAGRPPEEWGEKAAWIEFDMYSGLRDKYASDPRFAGVEDTQGKFWRVCLSRPEDVDAYRDVIVDEIG